MHMRIYEMASKAHFKYLEHDGLSFRSVEPDDSLKSPVKAIEQSILDHLLAFGDIYAEEAFKIVCLRLIDKLDEKEIHVQCTADLVSLISAFTHVLTKVSPEISVLLRKLTLSKLKSPEIEIYLTNVLMKFQSNFTLLDLE